MNERMGGHAYALYSDGCIKAMGIDPAVQGLVEHDESIDIIGDVKCWVRDLEEAWEKENQRKAIEITRDTAFATFEFDINASRPIVWEHFTVPGHRPKWQGPDEVIETTASGRRGVGTINHCMHGKAAIVEEVVDWRPFDYVTMNALVPNPGAPRILLTYAFGELEGGGTHLEVRIGKPKTKDVEMVTQIGDAFRQSLGGAIQTLRLLLEGQAGAPALVEEPEPPVSSERFITQPIHAH